MPDTLTLDEELNEGLNVPVMLGLTLIVEDAVLDRQMVGLPLTVEVGLSDAEAQKLLLCVPDTLKLDDADWETLSVPLSVGLVV